MAHWQQAEFCLSVKKKLPLYFVDRIVIDIGSLDINGNNQYLFSDCLYFGIDLAPGPNVDFVSPGHALGLPDSSIDTIVSTECLEHDQFYEKTLKNAVRLLKPGGMLIFSCATTGRPEHGTRRTTPHDAPFIQSLGEWSDYYKNLDESDIRTAIDVDSIFTEYEFSTNDETHDLYFWGIKVGSTLLRSDYSFQVQRPALQAEIRTLAGNVRSQEKTISERNQFISQLHLTVGERDSTIKELYQQIRLLNHEVAEKTKATEEKLDVQSKYFKASLDEVRSNLTECERKAIHVANELASCRAELASRDAVLASCQAELKRIHKSWSWRASVPIRIMGRLLRGELGLVKSAISARLQTGKAIRNENNTIIPQHNDRSARIYALASRLYHYLPVSPSTKLRLRRILSPFLRVAMEVSEGKPVGAAMATLKESRNQLEWGGSREDALDKTLKRLWAAGSVVKPISHIIVLPFLATGGAERVALNFSQAIRKIHPEFSVLIIVADRPFVDESVVLPEGVQLLTLDSVYVKPPSYQEKQQLLEDILVALRPKITHNINSEVAWHLILEKGSRLSLVTKLYASIFAFQFTPDGKGKIGYAEYYLKSGLPYLTALLSDNKRFIEDAVTEYNLSKSDKEKMHSIYNPVRVNAVIRTAIFQKQIAALTQRPHGQALKILWAGRLDEEKRIDLLFEVVSKCGFAEFYVFGEPVLNHAATLPDFPNLKYKGAFGSPEDLFIADCYDAFIFTSRWEGMPNILLEIGALGVPVIAPTVGGVKELINSETGYPLTERPSASDYLSALREVKDNPAEAANKAKKLEKTIDTKHSWPAFEAAIEKIPGYSEIDCVENARTE